MPEAQHKFQAVSDGSVLPMESASFRWILSSQQGEPLAASMGPVRGRTVYSYRAEAYGMLNFLRFLIHIGRCTQMHDTWIGTLATDRQHARYPIRERKRQETPYRGTS
jgi:hypothetical protein